MTRSPFPRIKCENGRRHASVPAQALDLRRVLHGAGAYFQIDAAPDQPGALLSEPDGFGQVLHRGLHAYAQTMAQGRGERNAKTIGVFA